MISGRTSAGGLSGSTVAPQARPTKSIKPEAIQQAERIWRTRITQFEQREDHRVRIGVIA